MMEHTKPKNPLIKIMYYLRLMSMGSAENKIFARDETKTLREVFINVSLEISPTGGSKLISGQKE